MDKFLNRSTKENEAPSPKRKRESSNVWQHFKKHQDKATATCLHCGKILKTSGNTTNIMEHLKRVHPNYKTFETDNESPRLDTYMQRNAVYPADSQQKLKVDRYIMLMIARDVQPFTIVDDPGFRELIQHLDPKYKMPSRTYFRDTMLPEMYNNLRNDVECELKGVQYVAITTDGWTSRANEAYLTVTCHFINQNFELVSAVLSTTTLVTSTNHTAMNVGDTLRQVLNEWDLQKKVVTIVTDNDATMKKACEHLEIKHFPCFAHTINLLVQEVLSMEIIRPILTKCKTVVAFVKRSSTTMAKFKDAQKVTDPLGLIQEVPTRWNSAFQMIQRILVTNEALSSALLGTAKAPPPFSADEINVLEELCSLLRPFEKATKLISGGKYPTMSLVIPMVCEMQTQVFCLKNSFKSPEVILAFDTLSGRFKERFGHYETRTVPGVATILDPRFKKQGFQLTNNADKACHALEEDIQSFIQKNVIQQSTSASQTPTPPNKEESSYTYFTTLQMKLKTKANTTRSDGIILLRQHTETTNEPESCEPLCFWRESSKTMEPFKEVVKKYFCVPATSCESERAFSKAGQVISDRRTRLKPNVVDKLMFVNKNYETFKK